MGLDRGLIARIDRKLLAGLGNSETYRMVRVPVTPAKWSTWKRYCDAVGVSMGRAIAILIERELTNVLTNADDVVGTVFGHKAEERMADREAKLARKEAELKAAEDRMRRWSEHLRDRESELEVREWRDVAAAKLAALPTEARTKTGRNERCPCGSGLKYKHCHGLPRL